MSITPSPPPDASGTTRGLVSLLAQTFAGVKSFTSKLVAAAGIELTSGIWSTLGTGASDVGVKVGFSPPDANINAAAIPWGVYNGLGGTEIRLAYVDATGGFHCGKAAGYGIFHGAGNGNQYLKVDPTNGVQLYLSGFTAGLNASGQFVAVSGGGNVARFDTTARLDQSGSDSSGTPGSRTGANAINKPSGKSAIAAGQTTCQIDNSLVASGDQVFITWHGDLGTQSKVPWVTTAAGSFTVNVGTAPAGAVAFCWVVQKRI